MKFKKPLSALVVSALLLGGASGALAASANLQLSLPTSEVPGGSHTQLTFTTNVPGFLTLTLTVLPARLPFLIARKYTPPAICLTLSWRMTAVRRSVQALIPSAAS